MQTILILATLITNVIIVPAVPVNPVITVQQEVQVGAFQEVTAGGAFSG